MASENLEAKVSAELKKQEDGFYELVLQFFAGTFIQHFPIVLGFPQPPTIDLPVYTFLSRNSLIISVPET